MQAATTCVYVNMHHVHVHTHVHMCACNVCVCMCTHIIHTCEPTHVHVCVLHMHRVYMCTHTILMYYDALLRGHLL